MLGGKVSKEELLQTLKVAYLWLDMLAETTKTVTNSISNELNPFLDDLKTILVHEGVTDKNDLN